MPGSISGSGRSPEREHGNPDQHSCPENPIDRGVMGAMVHRVTKSWIPLKQLSAQKHKRSSYINEEE